MFIAQRLKKENICEYLLYMWQIEDLIRAFQLNIDLIDENIIAPYPISETEKRTMYEWYESLIDMMRKENVQEKGHLQLNKNVIIDLNDFHELLLQSGADSEYNRLFYSILPHLVQLRKKAEVNINDIELCFNFLYGIMMLNLKKEKISDETAAAQNDISKFMALLAKDYKLYQEGELDLYK
ncbi:MAG TPA: DUF4924 family protein [Paludibacteraceae bacterium]|jgi:L-rhamnose mutarotase|nr:DUF4924 family protein [Paludibacteraceae bacterium]HOL29621.1 DUF4924 family protein [Paludibacteraceae bacterium]HON02868.1 DUF4924 family protein [Paludibacteraceae bacterium]HPD59748.1 DUF4924 family protein [Paludibacteraceae bacterium]HPQ13134.1 DUF4924 family protein [Paludibacteraceae bacterium]